MSLKIGLCVPTLNAGNNWKEWLAEFSKQDIALDAALVIDSSSHDQTVSLARSAGLTVHEIDKADFNHGATRQLGISLLSEMDIVVFLTQDAILASPDAISNLTSAFEDPTVGAAYGRQLPRKVASYIEQHSRVFNYSSESRINSFEDKDELGIKTAFMSNSFSAYRCTALKEAGGFPSNTIVSEDMYVAAKMLLLDWKVAYRADAQVFHSHGYSIFQEFQRYFDIGVFNAREPWITEKFGVAESEGARFVKSEIKFLLKNNPFLLPSMALRTISKLLGYRLGVAEAIIPVSIKRKFSMQKNYWQ